MLTIFGAIAVGIMFFSYWLEHRSRWFVLIFASGCAATSTYSWFLQAYPITGIEALWGLAALQRFFRRSREDAAEAIG